ncbi:MAG TPA: FeoA family protein [Candidatus Omnitrophota bacterium]|nr:FeoA family protein [Candidatus Omnitrophota bacterium]
MIRLTTIKSGEKVILISVDGGRSSEKRLLDMGLMPGEEIKVINNPGCGSLTVNLKGARVALGHGLASKLIVREA